MSPSDQADHAGSEADVHHVAGPELSARELHDILMLRVEVFVVEQDCAYQEIDGRDLDSATEHLWLTDDRGVSAALRILTDGAGRRIGRVVTRPDRRGERLAAGLIEHALTLIGDQITVLDAQSHLRAFYEGLGFIVAGAEFIEDGIPHLPMTNDPRISSPA